MDSKKKKMILIVEDVFVNREILKNILSHDYELIEAEDGKKALSQLEISR